MLELPPFESLALSLHHSPGTQALLVGSGLSRAAGIPTGWEITLELIRHIAALRGVTDHENWERWFSNEFGTPPNYSELLDTLAKTSDERRSILHAFIERKEGEDDKRPTKAHHAIAQLVASGAIKVIITTNFDRLLETALRDAGIEPTVIASADNIEGSIPLIHSGCTLIKVHGDYLDTRIKNTDTELRAYPPALNSLLDQIFDNFGLVVVGWSGEWDTALRDAISRAPTRRYPFYWAAPGEIKQSAQDLINIRGGRSFPIENADSFFGKLQHSLDALKLASRPHPRSIDLALNLAKKYCRDDNFNMEWVEFLHEETEKIRAYVLGPEYPSVGTDADTLNSIVDELTKRSEILRRACLICGRWGTEKANQAVIEAIKNLALLANHISGPIVLIELRNFAASMCFYWALAGILYDNNFVMAKQLLHTPIMRGNSDKIFTSALPFGCYRTVDWKFLVGRQNAKIPCSEYVFEKFQSEASDIFLGKDWADQLFDNLEFTIALEFAHQRVIAKSNVYFPLGRFIYKYDQDHFVFKEIDKKWNMTNDDPYLEAGLTGGTLEKSRITLNAVKQFIENDLQRYLH
jgi:hypothetical protein